MAPAAKVGAVAIVAALAVGGPWALWRAGIAQRTIERVETAFVDFTGMVGLVVDDVLVEGRVETKAADVLRALQVQRGMPVLAVDPRTAKQRLEQIPWVAEASVERRLPGLVSVRLVYVHAPQEAHDAERDVASAQEDKQRTINRAKGFAAEAVNEAKGEAAATVEGALAVQDEQVRRARGHVVCVSGTPRTWFA